MRSFFIVCKARFPDLKIEVISNQMRTPDAKANVRVIIALTLVHFTGDFYASFITPLLPVFADTFALSLTQIGVIAGLNRFLAFVVQPIGGYLADNYRNRIFLLGGLLANIVFIPLVGIAANFWILLLFVALGSIGQSMFHPPAAGMMTSYAGKHRGFSLSIFNVGGTLAFGLGPLFITYVVRLFGLGAAPWSMLIGLGIFIYLLKTVPRPEGEGLRRFGLFGAIKEALGGVWKMIALIWLIMALRAFVSQSFMTFMPMLYAREGYSLVSLGLVVSLFTVAGTVSGLLAGHLSDRIGHRPVFFTSHLLAAPLLAAVVHLRGNWIYPTAFLAGFFVMATLPLGVALAQELAPRGKSMVASLMMGFALGAGGILSPVVGRLADIHSIEAVLTALAIVPLASLGLIIFLPVRGSR
jgi:FSR family fosmidomycin resistance protein-like MFS transporter